MSIEGSEMYASSFELSGSELSFRMENTLREQLWVPSKSAPLQYNITALTAGRERGNRTALYCFTSPPGVPC